MEAKRKALEEIAARQIAADEKRQQEVGRQQQATVVSPNQWCFSNRLPRTVGASAVRLFAELNAITRTCPTKDQWPQIPELTGKFE
jgi:hypothetical protein